MVLIKLHYDMEYENILAHWLGSEINSMDDFDIICVCDLDFIEILIILENTFLVDLLETKKVRQDFSKVKDFIDWVKSRPQLQKPHHSFG